MKATVISFESQVKAIEVGGVEYVIPMRTPRVEEALQAWDKGRNRRTDLENYTMFFEIMFGESGATLTADGDDCNLDLLNKVYLTTIDLYYQEKRETERAKTQASLKELQPLIDKVGKATEIAKNINDRV